MSTVDKERILVERITDDDMKQFTMIPFQLDRPMHKFNEDKAHPFAWIEFDECNESIAKKELEYINGHINESKLYCEIIPKDLKIPINQIMFHKYDDAYGFSRLICNPYTLTGKTSKYPLSILFMTDLRKRRWTIGELFYGKDGSIMKGHVTIPYDGYHYEYQFSTVGRTLIVKTIKSDVKPDKDGIASIIYQFQNN